MNRLRRLNLGSKVEFNTRYCAVNDEKKANLPFFCHDHGLGPVTKVTDLANYSMNACLFQVRVHSHFGRWDRNVFGPSMSAVNSDGNAAEVLVAGWFAVAEEG